MPGVKLNTSSAESWPVIGQERPRSHQHQPSIIITSQSHLGSASLEKNIVFRGRDVFVLTFLIEAYEILGILLVTQQL